MTRTQIINSIIAKYGYKNYLEIGTQSGINFRQINCLVKYGIDPDENAQADSHVTSDSFFKVIDYATKFDCIFIDGMHEAHQFYRDVENSLKHLSDGGTIICHDCNPSTYEEQLMPRIQKVWTGDVWRGWMKLRSKRGDLKMFVVDTDFGVGIIQRGQQEKIPIFKGSWFDFQDVKNQLLPLKKVDKFKKWLHSKQ